MIKLNLYFQCYETCKNSDCYFDEIIEFMSEGSGISFNILPVKSIRFPVSDSDAQTKFEGCNITTEGDTLSARLLELELITFVDDFVELDEIINYCEDYLTCFEVDHRECISEPRI